MSPPRVPVASLVAWLLVVAGVARATPPARPPNIVLILADDLGYADVGFQGCTDIPTPNIDALARGGVRLSQGYVSHPFCSPTRAGLMTGRYQHRFGHENNPTYRPADPSIGLPTDQVTIAEALAKAGYATGHVGKWHLGAEARFRPNRRGFAESFGFLGGGHDYLGASDSIDGREYQIPILRNGEPAPFPGYLTDAFSDEAVAFVGRHEDRPFFLFLAYNAVHTPLQLPERRLARFAGIADPKRRAYAAMLSAMDDGIGRLLDALNAHDLERDTLVVFLSDNGGPPQANASSNTPLRGQKGTLYEGGIRVPFVARWPARLEAGVVRDAPVSSIDLFPTFLAAAGAEPPAGLAIDGVDILPALADASAKLPRDALFWRTGGGPNFAVRRGDLKLVREADHEALYDLKADPSESADLAADRPGDVAALRRLYEAWEAKNVPPLWPNPAGGAAAKAKKAAAASAAGKGDRPIKD